MLRILVVEDDPAVREILSIILTRHGCAVHTAPTAARALATVLYDNPHQPDLALVDIVLPDESGVKLAPVLLGHFPDMRVVFMTGYLDLGEREAAAAAYGPVLRKPFGTKELLAVLPVSAQRGCQ